MKTFLIVIACIIGWFVCVVLSALIGKKFLDFEEEMTDWFAKQFPKIQKVFKQLGVEE